MPNDTDEQPMYKMEKFVVEYFRTDDRKRIPQSLICLAEDADAALDEVEEGIPIAVYELRDALVWEAKRPRSNW